MFSRADLRVAVTRLTGLALLLAPRIAAAQADPDPSRWETQIKAFEAADLTNAPPEGAVLFVGSSSIRGWRTLAADFPGEHVINRGFGGSHIADSTAHAGRIVLPCKPRMVLLYAGDNDLAAGKTPEQVFGDYRAFVETVHSALPETVVAFISIKPSPSRWHLAESMRTANRLIADHARTHPRLRYIDVFTPMLDAGGKPREELFLSDKLHMNALGYAVWADAVKPHLAEK